MKKSNTKSYALRIDGPLVKPLQELKKQNRRSLNAEINAALEAWVAGAQRQTAPPEVVVPASSPAQPSQAEDAPKPVRVRKQTKRKSADVDANSKADSNADATRESASVPEVNA